MLEYKLNTIEKELKVNSKLTREELLTKCINRKLNETLKKYDFETDWNINYLSNRNDLKVLKAINKIQKRNDKENILNSIEEAETTNEDEEINLDE